MTFDLNSYTNTMARYSQWMNGSLYSAAASLALSQQGVDFGVTDLIFMLAAE
jgi:hypothetical protein